MQQNADGTEFYDERISTDKRFSYTIMKSASDLIWYVDCWRGDDNHWSKRFRDKESAIQEFNRFD